jgi:hypothetical protein
VIKEPPQSRNDAVRKLTIKLVGYAELAKSAEDALRNKTHQRIILKNFMTPIVRTIFSKLLILFDSIEIVTH